MAESTLNQVQRLVEQLSPHEQAHLLASLALRMAQIVTSTSGIRLRRDSWNMTAVTQKCTACPSLAAAALEA